MSYVAFNLTCACGASFVSTIEDTGDATSTSGRGRVMSQAEATAAIDVRLRRFEKAHASHTAKDRPDRTAGFDLTRTGGQSISAIASMEYDGEDDGYEDDDE